MRIAIALSAVWLFGATVYGRWVQADLRTGARAETAKAVLACLDKNTERRTHGEPEQRCGSDQEQRRALQSAGLRRRSTTRPLPLRSGWLLHGRWATPSCAPSGGSKAGHKQTALPGSQKRQPITASPH